MEIHYRQLLDITHDEINYIDSNEQTQTISFIDCRKNWVAFCNETDGTKTTLEDSFCVGWRDWFSQPKYFEFFSEPKVKVIFPYNKNWFSIIRNERKKIRLEFIRLQWKINDCGHTTYDLG
ncbi:hypothetical protein [Paenibacillus sp. RC67]|uniref:hypothetical protein n=1 Tax=Paenibacillus sp. RC67 TaxID=3039392 RepID=UPI0024ADAEE1|nr:hypothetical protein [Paenibacillus sp. RC67]